MTTNALIVALSIPAQQQQQQPSGAPILLLLVFFFIFYLMVLRPQTKARRKHEALKSSLKKGDKVVTDGGIIGTVSKVEDDKVTLDVGNRVNISFLKHSIRQRFVQDGEGKE